MKKIERDVYIDEYNGYIIASKTDCMVSLTDLDQLEREREEAENLIFEYCHEWYDFSPAEGNSYMYKKFVAYLEKTSGKTYQELKEMKG